MLLLPVRPGKASNNSPILPRATPAVTSVREFHFGREAHVWRFCWATLASIPELLRHEPMNFFARIALLAMPVFSALAPQTTLAQGYPNKPIRLVVPYAPGGATDIIARAAAAELSKTIGQPVTVDNRPGAGGNLGAEMVARSAPDGYTMLMSPSSLHGITPFLYSKLTYDPNKDLAPVIVLGAFANVLVVNPEVKANSVKELIDLIKSQPGKISYASSGSGSTIHMSGEMFKHMLNLDIAHVPYKGSAPALTDLIGGQVQLMFDNIPSAITQIRGGKLRALATTGPKRSATPARIADDDRIRSGGLRVDRLVWAGDAGRHPQRDHRPDER